MKGRKGRRKKKREREKEEAEGEEEREGDREGGRRSEEAPFRHCTLMFAVSTTSHHI